MPIIDNTPFDSCEIEGKTIHVKREDLSCPEGFPALSKLRGVERRLRKMKDEGNEIIGVLDTRISKSGWGCAALANEIGGISIVNFFPDLISYNGDYPENQKKVIKLGHTIWGLKGGRTAVLYSQAREHIRSIGGVMMPMGLVVNESVEGTENEARNLPKAFYGLDLVVCVGSGMMLSGIIKGASDKVNCIFAISPGMSLVKQKKRVEEVTGKELPKNVKLIMSKSGYYDKENIETPFPCNPYYDKKAWRWLSENIKYLTESVIFWNIGS